MHMTITLSASVIAAVVGTILFFATSGKISTAGEVAMGAGLLAILMTVHNVMASAILFFACKAKIDEAGKVAMAAGLLTLLLIVH